MHASLHRTFSVEATGQEVDIFKHVLKLAIDRLQMSRVSPLSGSPLTRQAGLKGADLINTKDMITKLAKELGMGEPDLEPSSTKLRDGIFDAFWKSGDLVDLTEGLQAIQRFIV